MYNSENYILKLLNSINRNFEKLSVEVILIDDGSKDSTVEKVKSYKQKKKLNLKIILGKHKGASYSRNKGIQIAKGYYIMFCDSDDVLISNFDKYIYYGLKNKIDIISFNTKVKYNKTIYSQDGIDDLIISMLLGNSKNFVPGEYVMGPYCKLFNRNFIIKNKLCFPQKIKWWEDLVFNLSCLTKAKSVYLVNKDVYKRKFNRNSLSHRVDSTCVDTAIKVLELSRLVVKNRKKGKAIFNQEQLFLIFSLLGSYFVYHPRVDLYQKFISNINLNRELIQIAPNIHSKILIWSLLSMGFNVTIFWYKLIIQIKNKISIV